MIIKLPDYKNGIPKFNGDVFEIDVNDYCKEINSLEAFEEKILNGMYENLNIEDCETIKDEIEKSYEKNIVYKPLSELRKSFDNRIKLILREYNEEAKLKYDDSIKNARLLIQKINSASTTFILNNKTSIFEILDKVKNKEIDKLRERKKEVNKRYYDKKKQILNIPDKTATMSEEEKKEKKRLANQKYREKQKQLNNNIMVEQEQEEEPKSEKDKKKQYNKTFYQKQKTLKERIKELEEKLNQKSD
jgi:hypothetical protein